MVKDWWKSTMDAAVETEKVTGRALDGVIAKLGEYKSAAADCHKAEVAAIDAALSRRKSEIDLIERQKKAEMELARQRRIAAGEDKTTVDNQTDAGIREASETAARNRAEARVRAAQSKVAAAEGAVYVSENELARLRNIQSELPETYNQTTPEGEKRIRALRRKVGGIVDAEAKNQEKAIAEVDKARAELEEAQSGLAALVKEQEAARLAARNAEVAAESEAARKAAEQRAAAEKNAAQEAAKEREKLDREAHQKRMADLRAEIAASKEAASPLQATAAAAKTEFERAFAMYRDPERARAEIAEERDRSDDLKRLHKDASRYGGKWRIDELSQLMAAGDSAGVQARLEDWRKSKSFSPEVEAMVRASAAEKTQTTAEDELRKIEGNTRNLSEKLDQLLTMKGN